MLESVRYSALASTWSPHYDRFLLKDDRHKPSAVELIQLAGQVEGLQGIELIHPAHVRVENVAQIRSALEDHHLALASMACSISSVPQYRAGSITSDDPVVRRMAIDTAKTTMDLSAELGGERINLWLGRDGFDYPFQMDYDLAWNRLVEAIREISSHRNDIRIGIEYKLKEPRRWILASTAPKAILLAEEVGQPNVGVLLDTGHALYAYENLAETLALLARKQRLVHVHFNDNTRLWDDDMIIGSQHFLEFFEMLYWLERIGYQGWLSFDPHPLLEDATRCVEISLVYVKGMLAVMEEIGMQSIQEAITSHQVTEIMALLSQNIFQE
jgi:sugar phosphate isomerase/epimerase